MLRRNCRVYIALDGGLVRPGPRLGLAYGSAQVSDGSGHAAQDCDVTGRSERQEEASSRSGPSSVSTDGRERGTTRPPGEPGR